MNRRTRLPVLLALSILVLWHGFMQGVPHRHAGAAVPRQLVTFAGSTAPLEAVLAPSPVPTSKPHLCLACLAGSAMAAAPEVGATKASALGPFTVAAGAPTPHLELHARLPLLRGPPSTV